MDRLNSEGIPRSHLLWALSERRFVLSARKLNSCLLCRRNGVNEAGLCQVCWSLLDDQELKQGQRWLMGIGP